MDGSGNEAALLLLRLLPAELTRRVLACLPTAEAKQLDAVLSANQEPLSPELEARALRAFFEAEHAPPDQAPKSPASDEQPTETNLLHLEPALLARALESEQPAAIAVVLGQLEPNAAAEVLKRLPASHRSEVAVRMCQTNPGAYVLADRLTKAVVEKARKLAEVPTAPTADARLKAFAAVLRRLPRPERAEVLAAIQKTEPHAVEKIRQDMFSFNDLQHIEDRPLQGLLAAIDLKTLALALKGADGAVADKVLRNTSSRTRQALSDEIALLANAPKTAVQDAQNRVAELLRMQEEEGKISFEA